MGTHRMGPDPDTSVVDGNQPRALLESVDRRQRKLSTIGTANPTLTIVAMALKTARNLLSTLG